jgi:hypothetical protein
MECRNVALRFQAAGISLDACRHGVVTELAEAELTKKRALAATRKRHPWR